MKLTVDRPEHASIIDEDGNDRVAKTQHGTRRNRWVLRMIRAAVWQAA
jgi:hypothetical protein